MAAFAATSDIEARWRPLTTAESAQAAVLLDDASAMLRTECRDLDARLAAVPPSIDPAVPLMVVCAMVKRVLIAGEDVDGVSAHQQTTGPFSQSLTFANPMGNLYITKAERKTLGCGGQRAFSIDLAPDANGGEPWV